MSEKSARIFTATPGWITATIASLSLVYYVGNRDTRLAAAEVQIKELRHDTQVAIDRIGRQVDALSESALKHHGDAIKLLEQNNQKMDTILRDFQLGKIP